MKNTSGNTPILPTKSKAPASRSLQWTVRGMIFFAAWLLTSFVLWFDYQDPVRGSEFVIGEPSPRTLFSEFQMTYENTRLTEEMREQIKKNVPPVYRLQPDIVEKISVETEKFFQLMEQANQQRAQGQSVEIGELPFEVSKATLRALEDPSVLALIRTAFPPVLQQLLNRGIFDPKEKDKLLDARVGMVTLTAQPGTEGQMLRSPEILTPQDIDKFLETVLPPETIKNRTLKNVWMEVLSSAAQINVREDAQEWESYRNKASGSVVPVTSTIKKNELIAQRGVLITAEDKEKIDYLQKEHRKHRVIHQWIAVSSLAFAAYLMAFVYLLMFLPKTLLSLRSVLLIHVSLLTTLLISKGIAIWPGSSFYLMPAALAPLLLILLSDARIAFMSSVLLTVFVAPLAKFNVDVILATQISGCAAIFSGMRIRKRVQFVKVGMATGFSYFAVLLIFRVFHEYPFIESLQVSALGLVNGLLITVPLCFLLLPLFEWLFSLTTDITLLELSDLNHPLLKRMIVEAPGTYHHSLVVSTLAEGACEAIGANALLARVGCYFHDIGKIARAEYFTENQNGGQGENYSRHDELHPQTSSELIRDHVKSGLELGKKYNLKEPILKFIPEHQGTGVVYFFYRKALDQAKPGEKVDADLYRYPGPKPQSRETAVALLADSTEAASRSLKEPTAEGIQRLVRKIFNDKFIDGQLDECDLTLKDLHQIQKSFVTNLMAIFHTRVPYPEKPHTPGQPNLFENDPASKARPQGFRFED